MSAILRLSGQAAAKSPIKTIKPDKNTFVLLFILFSCSVLIIENRESRYSLVVILFSREKFAKFFVF
jgi:hypothetical protein